MAAPSTERPITPRLSPWLLRVSWVIVLWLGGAAVDGATADRSDAVHQVAVVGGGVLWVLGVAAMAVPAAVTLTATRVVVPLAVPAAVVASAAGAGRVEADAFLAAAALATVIVFGADTGRAFVQASAYGDEGRFPLRAPVAYLLAAGLAWMLWAACVIAGPLLLADSRWVVGGVVTAVAMTGTAWAWPRWHRLSRRWLVLVPVGVVVHDPLVLGETLMLRRHELGALRLAPSDTEAFDLTGPASGHAIEILTNDSVTVILASTPREPQGRVIHLTGCLVSPSRPGQALRAAARRRLPVG